jgi:putative SOS response-associated peptidase YedK
MCGRYNLTTAPEAMRRLFRYREQPNFPPRYNIAPTQPVAIVRLKNGVREFALVRWGLIPSWVKDPRKFSVCINARAETLLDKPSFRAAVRRRRCLIPADGCYHWQPAGRVKRPFLVHPRAGGPIAYAGVWETWSDPQGGEIDSCAIVTVPASRAMAPIHDRMPAVVPPEHFDAWLDAERVDAETAVALLGPAPEDFFEAYEISPRVNKVANDDAGIVEPVNVQARSPDGREAAEPGPSRRLNQAE